ncbi:MAG: hypothetical protein H0W58_11095 [Acidobacteria bacterium]|nr:hypothetical protein [Acidobacteriota bacterium]
MSENGTVTATDKLVDATAESTETNENTENAAAETANETSENTGDLSYHAVEKEGNVTAIWEMQGRKHIRTIDPRSNEGKQILALFETAA